MILVIIGLCYVAHAQEWVWARSFGSANMESAWDLTVYNGNSIYVTGSYTDTLYIDNLVLYGNGLDDIFVVKVGWDGNTLWARSFGSSEEDVALSISSDNSGNVYLTGFMNADMQIGNTTLVCQGMWDIFVIKLNAYGDVIFAKSFGGSLNDIGYGITVADDRFFITGWFADTLSFGDNIEIQSFGGSDIYVACFDLNGNPLWAKRAGTAGVEYGFDITSNGNGDCFLTGVSSHGTDHDGFLLTGDGAFVAKYDMNGNFIWASRISGAGVNSIGYYTGYNYYGGDEDKVYVTGRFSGSIIGGNHSISSVAGSDDAYYAFFNVDSGEVLSLMGAGGIEADMGRACNSKSFYYSAPAFFGSFSDMANIWGRTMTSMGGYDMFGYAIDMMPEVEDGVLTQHVYAGGEGNVVVTGVGEVYSYIVCGWHFGESHFGDITINSGSISNGNAFVAFFSPAIVENEDPLIPQEQGLKVYPNPFREETKIELTGTNSKQLPITIYNLRGQALRTLELAKGENVLHWDGRDEVGKPLPAGVYMLRYPEANRVVTKKICKW